MESTGTFASSPARMTAELRYVLWLYRWRIGAAVAFLVLAKLATVAVPLLLKRIIDAFSQPGQLARLPLYLLAGYALLRFAATLFTELRDLVFARVTLHTVSAYAQKIFAHLLALDASFHARRQIGSLLPEIDRGTNGIAFLLGVALFTLVPTLIEIGMVMGIMLDRYSSWFAVVIAVTFVLYAGFTLLFASRRVMYQRRVNKLDSTAKGQLADSLINYDTIKYFANEAVESRRFGAMMEGWMEAGLANQRALFGLHIGQSLVIALGVGAIMLLAGEAVWHGRMSVGDLVLINAYTLQLCLPLNALGFMYREARDARVNTERLFELLRERPRIEELPDLPRLEATLGQVRFEHVCFCYEPGRRILEDVDFCVPPGRTVAVVGRSGSGKSTLARLLLRFYDPDQGGVLIDGLDIIGFSPASVRRAIGVVPQDTVLFNDTIGYNIAYGRIGASREDVIAAARAAHIHELIASLPQQYDTMVGERGVKLSGGERQRIAIARAILKNPVILVFDEATSALDADSEHAIQQELNRLSVGRTTLVIAHRLSSIVAAYEILVMDKGRIVERGTHADLLRRKGLYSRLWLLQQHLAREDMMQPAASTG
ncbi:MAG: transporter ATP-binding protein/permease [Massilia sp.]|nr:transporter ATP-binding protein/permease [Massilia sp.]